MKAFMIFSGRGILKRLIFLPLILTLLFASGVFFGELMSSIENATDETSSVADATAENEEDNSGPFQFVCSMMAGATVLLTTGTAANYMFRTDGSKMVRTVKNAKRKYIRAYLLTSVLSVISSAVGAIMLTGVLALLTPDFITVEAAAVIVFSSVIVAVAANALCSIVLFIDNVNARSLVTGIGIFIAGAIGIVLYAMKDNSTFVYLLTAAILLAYIIVYLLTVRRINRHWLFS